MSRPRVVWVIDKLTYYCYVALRVLYRILLGKRLRDRSIKKEIKDIIFSSLLFPMRKADTMYTMYEESFIEEVSKLRNGCVFIDVGAAQGFYINMLLNRAQKIVALEPNPKFYKKLKQIYGNRKNVILLNFAAASKEGTAKLFVPSSRFVLTADLGSSLHNLLGFQSCIEVHTKTLDQITDSYKIDFVDCIKIDVEGAEYDVLLGAKETLHKTKKVLVEIHDDSLLPLIEKLLSNYGFSIRRAVEEYRKQIFLIASRNDKELCL